MFARAPSVRFSGVSETGTPLVRTFSAVVIDGSLYFHAGDHGEKLELVGRHTLASADEVIGQMPSYWVNPSIACPASTYYLSAHAEGVVRRVDDLEKKARVLRAMMERFQPEGGYLSIHAGEPKYKGVLSQLLVAELEPERLSMRKKLGQKRSLPEIERVLCGLWQRGAHGDLRAIRLIREAHPKRPEPPFLKGIAETSLCVHPGESDAAEVADLLKGHYWTLDLTHEQMVRAHLGSNAWVVARNTKGEVVGSARAISDGGRFAWVLDVVVRPDLRGVGLGTRIMECLLDHPRLRGLHTIGLRTRDAHSLYERFGFARVPGDELAMVKRAPAR